MIEQKRPTCGESRMFSLVIGPSTENEVTLSLPRISLTLFVKSTSDSPPPFSARLSRKSVASMSPMWVRARAGALVRMTSKILAALRVMAPFWRWLGFEEASRVLNSAEGAAVFVHARITRNNAYDDQA